jgi:RNA methyltransferase, TrmH family
VRITSPANPRIKSAVRLRQRQGREDQRRIIIDGVREIGRAIEAGVEVGELFYLPELCGDDEHQAVLRGARRAGAMLIDVTPSVIEKLAYGNRVEGVVATAGTPQRRLEDLPLTADALVAVVEGLEKPGNLGAILRTADAAGVGGLIVAEGGTDLFNPNAIRASLGAIFSVPVCLTTGAGALAWLREHRFKLYATRVDAALDYTAANLRGRSAIVLGSEAEGLSDLWRAGDVTAIRLPMLGTVDSLNVSATAAVLFYEALRQRRGG